MGMLKRYVEQLKAHVHPLLNMAAQSHFLFLFFLPSPNHALRLLYSTKRPHLQLVDQKFFGNNEPILNHPNEQLVSTWEAINWCLDIWDLHE